MSDYNSLNVKGSLNSGVNQIVFESVLSSPATSVTISGLTGDTALSYALQYNLINAYSGSATVGYTINSDSSTYGKQSLSGSNTTASAARTTSDSSVQVASHSAVNDICSGEIYFSSKTGTIRTSIGSNANGMATTTVNSVSLVGGVYDDTATEITTLTLTHSQTNGINTGSRIALYARRPNVATTNSANVKGGMTAGVDTIVYENTLSSAATSVTISGLDGDTDQAYRVIIRGRAGADSSPAIYLNNDNTAGNYGNQRLTGSNATTSAGRNTSRQQADLCFDYTTSGNIWMTDTVINAKSGNVRTMTTLSVSEVSGTSVRDVSLFAVSWNNTASNLTSIVLSGGYANCYGVGTYICLLRPSRSTTTANAFNSFSTPMGQLFADCFETIAEGTLGSNQTSVTMSGLDGNTDVVYKFSLIEVCGAGASAYIRPNNDTGANYGDQRLTGASTTAEAARATGNSVLTLFNQETPNSGDVSVAEMLMYAKSGYIRTALVSSAEKIATTTVTRVEEHGVVWSDTSSNITSMVLMGGTFNTGTRYRLQTLKRKS